MGLYDQYKLSNSTAVPLFTGSTAPEALQVAEHLQGLYDSALMGAEAVGAGADSMQAMTKDYNLRSEIQKEIKDKIDGWAAGKDWENQVPNVRALGRYYAQRSKELSEPLKKYEEYRKELDDTKYNLNSNQRRILEARSLAGYKGMQRDKNGKLVGDFAGVEPTKNIDYTKWADDVIKDMKEFKGGNVVEYSDGKGYLVERGNTREWVSNERVQSALNAAMQMSPDVRAFAEMESANAGFVASRVPISRVPDMINGQPNVDKQEAMALAETTGLAPETIYGKLVERNTSRNLVKQASDYVKNKYVYDNKTSKQGLTGDSTWQYNEGQKEKAALGLFGDAVTGAGIDLTARFGTTGDIETSSNTAAAELDRAETEVMAKKQQIAKTLGVPVDKLNNDQISGYFSLHEPAGVGKYKANLQTIDASKGTIAELSQLRNESMDLAVRKKYPNMTFQGLKDKASTDLMEAASKGTTFNAIENGKKIKIGKDNAANYEVIDGDSSVGSGSDNYIIVRNKKTGATSKVIPGYSNDPAAVKELGKRFDGIDWKSTWKEAATNIRSNSVWMPLQNKTTPDGQFTKAGLYAGRVTGVLRSGARSLSIKDANLTDMGSDDKNDMKARISAGKFELLGVGKVGSDGKLYAQVSVEVDKDAEDPAKRFKEIVVGVDSNMANKLAGYAMEAGIRDQDHRALQFGMALRPGSGYEKALDMGTTGRVEIKDANNKSVYEVVPNISGQDSNALSYEVYKVDANGNRSVEGTISDAFELGEFLDRNSSAGRKVVKKTK